MVAHKCTPLRNAARHRQGAAAVERRAAAVKRRAAAVKRRAAAAERRAAAAERRAAAVKRRAAAAERSGRCCAGKERYHVIYSTPRAHTCTSIYMCDRWQRRCIWMVRKQCRLDSCLLHNNVQSSCRPTCRLFLFAKKIHRDNCSAKVCAWDTQKVSTNYVCCLSWCKSYILVISLRWLKTQFKCLGLRRRGCSPNEDTLKALITVSSL